MFCLPVLKNDEHTRGQTYFRGPIVPQVPLTVIDACPFRMSHLLGWTSIIRRISPVDDLAQSLEQR